MRTLLLIVRFTSALILPFWIVLRAPDTPWRPVMFFASLGYLLFVVISTSGSGSGSYVPMDDTDGQEKPKEKYDWLVSGPNNEGNGLPHHDD